MQKYINLSSSGWSATGRIYIFGNILDLDFLCSTNAMGTLEKFQYGCTLFSNKQGTIYGFYCSYLQSWLFGSYLQSVNRKGTQPIKILAALAAVKISSVSGRSIRVAMNWRLLLSISARSASSAVIGASGGEISEANHAS